MSSTHVVGTWLRTQEETERSELAIEPDFDKIRELLGLPPGAPVRFETVHVNARYPFGQCVFENADVLFLCTSGACSIEVKNVQTREHIDHAHLDSGIGQNGDIRKDELKMFRVQRGHYLVAKVDTLTAQMSGKEHSETSLIMFTSLAPGEKLVRRRADGSPFKPRQPTRREEVKEPPIRHSVHIPRKRENPTTHGVIDAPPPKKTGFWKWLSDLWDARNDPDAQQMSNNQNALDDMFNRTPEKTSGTP